jgi:hypothetical protein
VPEETLTKRGKTKKNHNGFYAKAWSIDLKEPKEFKTTLRIL